MPDFVLAKDQIMEDYLTSLLTDVPSVEEENSLTTVKSRANVIIQSENHTAKESSEQVEEIATALLKNIGPESHIIQNEFEALFFDVAGLTLAVPLTQLGGIHKVDKIAPLFGKPNWFKGVMLHNEKKLNVVDTTIWVMPEKQSEDLADSINYQYLIMLDESPWGLACEALVSTETLQQEDVKWRKPFGKRPWLAGTVKEKMCVLINVQQLIELLENGLGSNEE